MRQFTIPNLMQYVVIGQGIVFALMMIWPTVGYTLLRLITLNRDQIFHLQVWRLVTFVFVPPSSSPLFIIFALYFYYFIGQGLERLWGSARFCLFYYIGMLGAILACLITGYADNSFLNLSLFFAYAAMWPDEQVLLFMIIPVKMKYLAILDAVLFLQFDDALRVDHGQKLHGADAYGGQADGCARAGQAGPGNPGGRRD